jgi:hydroxypyruvate isomerase
MRGPIKSNRSVSRDGHQHGAVYARRSFEWQNHNAEHPFRGYTTVSLIFATEGHNLGSFGAKARKAGPVCPDAENIPITRADVVRYEDENNPMNRRDFSRILAGAVLCASGLPLIAAEQKPVERAKLPLPFKLSVMLWTFFEKLPLEERLEKAAEAGYTSVEGVGNPLHWSEDDFRRLERKKRSLGLNVDANGGFTKGAADPAARDALSAELKTLLAFTARTQCSNLIIQAGDRIPGLSREQQREACVESLKRLGDIAAKDNVTIMLENIDLEENPKYYLPSSAEGLEIIRKVNHPNVRFLFDIYHAQVAEGNLIERLDNNIEYIGLIHVADVPGRHEPGTGEINYVNIFRKLAELHYDRYAAMEFFPSGDAVATLIASRKFVLQSLNGSE